MNLLFAVGFIGVLLTQPAQASVVSPQQQARLSTLPAPESAGDEE